MLGSCYNFQDVITSNLSRQHPTCNFATWHHDCVIHATFSRVICTHFELSTCMSTLYTADVNIHITWRVIARTSQACKKKNWV